MDEKRVGGAELPVAVIGAGPVGLAAAAHLVARGLTPLVLEAGGQVGASIRRWSHVRLFSPWKYLVDPAARTMLQAAGWTEPDGEVLPTGGELVARYLEPLAALPRIAPHVRTGRRVEAVSRRGYDKVKTAGREQAPFELVVRTADGRGERLLARAVIDASGTCATPNPMGASGLPVEGEAELAHRIRYGIPDALGRDRARYAGRRTLVVGSGHSAFNALLELTALARRAPGTEVVWAIRRTEPALLFGGGEKDRLPARGSLGTRLRELLDDGGVKLIAGFRTTGLVRTERGIVVEGEDEAVIGPVDELVVATGFRPELGMLRELRTRLDPWLEAPVALGPLIDPNVHSCGTVYPHGFQELSHPERDLYVVGMKSYGRAPTFLLPTGYEQVRSVAAALAGDLESARKVELVLPETGVCATDLGGSGCCSVQDQAGTTHEPVAGSCGIAAGCASGLAVLAGARVGGCCG
ncbi:MAG: NAD(P)-binding domain-containing protein [Gemmatimonadetes bacterium]|nr:NAD(P)-binding domain-containing protein [Gemmatimonadota bacterium]